MCNLKILNFIAYSSQSLYVLNSKQTQCRSNIYEKKNYGYVTSTYTDFSEESLNMAQVLKVHGSSRLDHQFFINFKKKLKKTMSNVSCCRMWRQLEKNIEYIIIRLNNTTLVHMHVQHQLPIQKCSNYEKKRFQRLGKTNQPLKPICGKKNVENLRPKAKCSEDRLERNTKKKLFR